MHIIGPRCRERFMPILKSGPLHQLGVGCAGVSDLSGRYCMSRPNADISVILGTLSGHALLTTDTYTRELLPGNLLIAPQGISNRYELIRGQKWSIVWFNIARALPVQQVRVLHVNLLEKITREIIDICDESAFESFLSQEARLAKENYLSVMLHRILHSEKSESLFHREKQLRGLWSEVLNNLSRPWTLETLAEVADCSAGHLNRLCRQFYGHPAMNHLTRLRMEYAAGLLSLGTYKMGIIAKLCGYDNPFAFSVAFKRNFGTSPTNFRH
jgi:AraC-like DNA-binding protein